ncbi:hypothetical protein [Actinomadura barringtoniae]|nr:hypothetical protein [Actinomadura barringtoniae]
MVTDISSKIRMTHPEHAHSAEANANTLFTFAFDLHEQPIDGP